MSVIARSGDPLDRITHHVTNLWRVWKGEPVRDLDESEVGYESAMRELRGAVDVERIARVLAEHITGVTVRQEGEPVDVCRFHRDLAAAIVGGR